MGDSVFNQANEKNNRRSLNAPRIALLALMSFDNLIVSLLRFPHKDLNSANNGLGMKCPPCVYICVLTSQ